MRVVAVVCLLSCAPLGQELPVIREASFEAATIRRNDTGRLTWNVSPGRYVVTNVTMERFITASFQLHPDQLAGLPAWAREEGWDVTARFDPSLGRPADNSSIWQLGLRQLLAERAQLSSAAKCSSGRSTPWRTPGRTAGWAPMSRRRESIAMPCSRRWRPPRKRGSPRRCRRQPAPTSHVDCEAPAARPA